MPRPPQQRRLALAPETFARPRVLKPAPHDDGNAYACAMFLRDPARWGGDAALAVRWAHAWQAKRECGAGRES